MEGPEFRRKNEGMQSGAAKFNWHIRDPERATPDTHTHTHTREAYHTSMPAFPRKLMSCSRAWYLR